MNLPYAIFYTFQIMILPNFLTFLTYSNFFMNFYYSHNFICFNVKLILFKSLIKSISLSTCFITMFSIPQNTMWFISSTYISTCFRVNLILYQPVFMKYIHASDFHIFDTVKHLDSESPNVCPSNTYRHPCGIKNKFFERFFF